jgi:hypothetical protein
MLAEQIKNVLSAVAIDFLEGEYIERNIYLYPEDVVADGVEPLPKGKAIRFTLTYVDVPPPVYHV